MDKLTNPDFGIYLLSFENGDRAEVEAFAPRHAEAEQREAVRAVLSSNLIQQRRQLPGLFYCRFDTFIPKGDNLV